jgi:ArsR family transcriptional regulator
MRKRTGNTAAPQSRADRELALLSKALGHPTRVAILRFLCRRGGCVCGEIVGYLPFAQATVSQHLKVLKDAGLLQGEINGPRVCYCPDPEVLARMRVLLDGLQPEETTRC